MARTTITHITDDLDGSKDAEELSFSFRGVDYVIDLSKKNQAAMEKALKPFLDAATRTPRRSAQTSKRSTTKASRSGSAGRPDFAAVRDWARAQGIDVSERGRVAKSVIEQYTAAHG